MDDIKPEEPRYPRNAASGRTVLTRAEKRAPLGREISAPSIAAIKEEANSDSEESEYGEGYGYSSNDDSCSEDGDHDSDSGGDVSDSGLDRKRRIYTPSTMNLTAPTKRTRHKKQSEDCDAHRVTVKAEDDDANMPGQYDSDGEDEVEDEDDEGDDEKPLRQRTDNGHHHHHYPRMPTASTHEIEEYRAPFVHPRIPSPHLKADGEPGTTGGHSAAAPEGMISVFLPVRENEFGGQYVRYHIPQEVAQEGVPAVKHYITRNSVEGLEVIDNAPVAVPTGRRRRINRPSRPRAPDAGAYRRERTRTEHNAGGSRRHERSRSEHGAGVQRRERSRHEHRHSPYAPQGAATPPYMFNRSSLGTPVVFPASAPPGFMQPHFAMGYNFAGLPAFSPYMCPQQQLQGRLMYPHPAQLQPGSPQGLAFADRRFMYPPPGMFGPPAGSPRGTFPGFPPPPMAWHQTIQATMQPLYQQQQASVQGPQPPPPMQWPYLDGGHPAAQTQGASRAVPRSSLSHPSSGGAGTSTAKSF